MSKFEASSNKGYKIAHFNDIPPMEDSFTKGWHSVRWHFGIKSFGVNAITREKGDWLTKEHDEVGTGQQELFIILEGSAEFRLDGQKVRAPSGTMVAVTDPKVKRSADALESPTTMLIVGSPPDKMYIPPDWA